MAALCEAVFPSATGILGDVRALVGEACRRAGCGDACTEQTVLAVNEACMNIIEHGYHFAADHVFRVVIFAEDEELTVQLLDNGERARDSDLRPRKLDDIRPGGLGVHFMREVMDTVAYRAPPAGYVNLLQLTKRIY